MPQEGGEHHTGSPPRPHSSTRARDSRGTHAQEQAREEVTTRPLPAVGTPLFAATPQAQNVAGQLPRDRYGGHAAIRVGGAEHEAAPLVVGSPAKTRLLFNARQS